MLIAKPGETISQQLGIGTASEYLQYVWKEMKNSHWRDNTVLLSNTCSWEKKFFDINIFFQVNTSFVVNRFIYDRIVLYTKVQPFHSMMLAVVGLAELVFSLIFPELYFCHRNPLGWAQHIPLEFFEDFLAYANADVFPFFEFSIFHFGWFLSENYIQPYMYVEYPIKITNINSLWVLLRN